MKVSVVIPTYRPGDYIWKCLESLRCQTLQKSQFEVVIVLNGCDEPYHQMMRDGLKEMPDLNVRLYQTDQPGVSNARNLALAEAKGDDICFLDDDDWVSKNYLEGLLSHLSKDAIAVANVLDCDEETGRESKGYIARAFERLRAEGSVSLLKGRSFMSSSCCKLIPRDLIGDKRFDTRFRLGEDALFMASLSARVKQIVMADEDVVYYRRIRGISASRKGESRWGKAKYAMRLAWAYVKLYFKDVRRNNFRFFLSRVAASLLKIVKKTWI